MTKLTLTWIKREEKVSARTNKPFTSLSIKTQEHGDRYLSGFGNEANKDWKVGDTVEVESVEEKESNGKTYLNFNMPKGGRGGLSSGDTAKIITMLTNLTVGQATIIAKINALGRAYEEKNGVMVTKDETIPADILDVNKELDSYPENDLGEIDFEPKE